MTIEDLKEDSFLEWLKDQPSDRRFDVTEPKACMIACWLRETRTISDPVVGICRVSDSSLLLFDRIMFPEWLQRVSDRAMRLKTWFTIRDFREAYQTT